MAKLVCVLCGAKSSRYHIFKDGSVCSKCLSKAQLPTDFDFDQLSLAEFGNRQNFLENKRPWFDSFRMTSCVSDSDGKMLLELDEEKQLWRVNGQDECYKFEELIRFEYLEDGVTATSSSSSGGLGSAVVGGLLFGGVGAVVGGLTGNRESTSTSATDVRLASVRISLNNKWVKNLEIVVSTGFTPTYQVRKLANEIISRLEVIQFAQQHAAGDRPAQQPLSPPDPVAEIERYFGLKERGIITDEEFQAKKKQLLDL